MCSTSVSDQVCDLNLIALFSLSGFLLTYRVETKTGPQVLFRTEPGYVRQLLKVSGYGSPHIVYSFNTCELLAAINMTKY